MRLAAVALVSLMCAGLAFSQSTATKTKSAKSGSPVTIGKVVSTDDIMKTIIISHKSAQDTFTVDAAAKITKDKADITLADLTAGTTVTVTYKKEAGAKVATKITVHVAKAAKTSSKKAAPAAQ
jgi:hypothetical protein